MKQRKGDNDRRKYDVINLRERMLPTSAGIEPATSWSPDGRRIQLSHRGWQALPVFKMKNKTSFESRAYIKGRVGLNVSVSQIYSELCQIHWTSVVSKRSVFRWHKYFKGGKTDEPRPGQPRKAATKAYVAAVADMVKQNARFTVKEIGDSSYDFDSGVETSKGLCTMDPASLDQRSKDQPM